ncbi:hypothetical protein HRJ35_13895 [Shewanella oneidensis MR-1]|uniref:Uncharacterized protein n=1 Tax=Shewanella oneidensis (strain ATCC 700550 / JCM 31522 / CIP 106686 / LMG 19005 / NCIMB 14063 / MR-1) TaxID=211586 RepID=Q8EEC2_SHEON|nr:hypothetical protein [Shewanella oneidensis]AAN55494.1 uncharacterized protein SO_2460 [Shewanella oneidensis MR-1]MDX5995851.1 hypothetical protein [Shewanella oneidensis]MEE2027051.1 hypothetical protein [Shewanella oneidensis]QKG96991.1 hypothetical protein HRJ35_13895 [Shewanella oneidensis MR-1]
MKYFKIAIKWTLLTILLVPVGLYLALLVINLKDSPASEQAKAYLLEIQESDKALANNQTQNAYLYALGFDAKSGTSPVDEGISRLQTIQQIGMLEHAPTLNTARIEKPQTPFNECINRDDFLSSCLPVLTEQTYFNELLATHAELITRYKTLIQLTTWQEGSQFNVFLSSPSLSHLLTAQKLYFIDLLAQAQTMPPQQIAEAINQDMFFWQRVAANTHALLIKNASKSGISTNMKFGELILGQLSHSQLSNVIPISWQTPIPAEVTAFEKTKVGEWYFLNRMTKAMQTTDNTDITATVTQWLLMPLMQHQDTVNRYAAILDGTTPLHTCPNPWFMAEVSQFMYNPLGKFALCSGITSLAPYQQHFDELEPQRAQLITRLQLKNIASHSTSVAPL